MLARISSVFQLNRRRHIFLDSGERPMSEGAIMTTDGLQENAMIDKAKGDSPQDVIFAHASMVNGSQACLLLRRKTG
ncbi:uncharacterized protein PADG_06446 [Paracoccidioides brasiliensis Pb18]|uniref:Uncharacterized protein n=1 Tax=Paracoccidioides brasiliensis (strain Pb18) TaxID=502780 RepID=C1GGK9_PARBD|nr:uncharacterized protein PADG_06446 [Paracoccidioides brasiliensis Pb18]EEH50367.2 hypothetical protein PADG_06446 [Paracoccidioides brasiliensis Pb18]